MNWHNIINGFEINKNFIWLNNAGVAPMHNEVRENLISFIKKYNESCILQNDFDYTKIIVHLR